MNSEPVQKKLGSSVLPRIAQDLLNEIERIYKEQQEISDESLLALHSVFGSPCETALELLDANAVTFLRVPGGKRSLVQVVGSSGMLYTFFHHGNYCPCPAYRYHVIGNRSHVTCKHVLAARLAEITGKFRNINVSPEEMSQHLCAVAGI